MTYNLSSVIAVFSSSWKRPINLTRRSWSKAVGVNSSMKSSNNLSTTNLNWCNVVSQLSKWWWISIRKKKTTKRSKGFTRIKFKVLFMSIVPIIRWTTELRRYWMKLLEENQINPTWNLIVPQNHPGKEGVVLFLL